MNTIPPYFFKRAEEIARGVAVALLLYFVQVAATWDPRAFTDAHTALRSVGAGAVAVAYATLRATFTAKAPAA